MDSRGASWYGDPRAAETERVYCLVRLRPRAKDRTLTFVKLVAQLLLSADVTSFADLVDNDALFVVWVEGEPLTAE